MLTWNDTKIKKKFSYIRIKLLFCYFESRLITLKYPSSKIEGRFKKIKKKFTSTFKYWYYRKTLSRDPGPIFNIVISKYRTFKPLHHNCTRLGPSEWSKFFMGKMPQKLLINLTLTLQFLVFLILSYF